MRINFFELRAKIVKLWSELRQLLSEGASSSTKKGIITLATTLALFFGMTAIALLIFDNGLLKWLRILVLFIFAFGVIGIGVVVLTVHKMW
jgi:hypothetical protein